MLQWLLLRQSFKGSLKSVWLPFLRIVWPTAKSGKDVFMRTFVQQYLVQCKCKCKDQCANLMCFTDCLSIQTNKICTVYHCTLKQSSINGKYVKWGIGVYFSGRRLYDNIQLLSGEVWMLSCLSLRCIHKRSLNWRSVSYHPTSINLAMLTTHTKY
jgi:hypothetical protein